MTAARVSEGVKGDRLSPVAAAVLALVIERPSYGYELWKRFEGRFASLYPVTTPRIYQVLGQLEERGLVEEIPVADGDRPTPRSQPQKRRQPKPHYRATDEGLRVHREWIAASFRDDPHREELLRRLLATSVQDAAAMLEIVNAYERICLGEMTTMTGANTSRRARDSTPAARLRDLLIAEEQRLVQESRLKFIAFARRAVAAEIEGKTSD